MDSLGISISLMTILWYFRQVIKTNVHARISSLPVCPELCRVCLPRSKDVGRFLSISATVIRTTSIKVLEYERIFKCNKCKCTFPVKVIQNLNTNSDLLGFQLVLKYTFRQSLTSTMQLVDLPSV